MAPEAQLGKHLHELVPGPVLVHVECAPQPPLFVKHEFTANNRSLMNDRVIVMGLSHLKWKEKKGMVVGTMIIIL